MLKKVIAFADGENLVMRYQDILKSGQIPKEDVKHIADCFVWSPAMTTWSVMDLIRFSYYSSVVGDDVKQKEIEKEISETKYQCLSKDYAGWAHLIPRIYKKESKSIKQKIIDINLTIDVMRTALEMPVDGIYILSGDSDFLQLVQEISRRTSKQVYLAAFSSGLKPELKSCVEEFIDLDSIFFKKVDG